MRQKPPRVVYTPVQVQGTSLVVAARTPPAEIGVPHLTPYIARLMGLDEQYTFDRRFIGVTSRVAFGQVIQVRLALSRLQSVEVLEIRCTDPEQDDLLVRRYYTWLSAEGTQGLVETSQVRAVQLVRGRPANGWGTQTDPASPTPAAAPRPPRRRDVRLD